MRFRFLSFTAWTAAVGAVVLPSCGKNEAEGAAAPTGGESSLTDAFAGRTVRSHTDIEGIVIGRQGNAPKVGDQAPVLKVTDAVTGEAVGLDDLIADGPVVLLFTSATCGAMKASASHVSRLMNAWRDRIRFFVVYIREAHARDGFPEVGIDGINDPKTRWERSSAALQCRKSYTLRARMLVDVMEDTSAVNWAGWPSRIFVVDQDRRVVYAGGQGPWLFRPTRDWAFFDSPPPTVHIGGFSKESLEEFLEGFLEPTTN